MRGQRLADVIPSTGFVLVGVDRDWLVCHLMLGQQDLHQMVGDEVENPESFLKKEVEWMNEGEDQINVCQNSQIHREE